MELVNLLICRFASSAMALNANLEKNFSWLAFPGLIRAIISIQAIVYALILIKPETDVFFVMSLDGLDNGEYWRLISWVFHPLVHPWGRLGPVVSLLFFWFTMRIGFLISDSLEHAWGDVRTSFYVYAVILCQVAIFTLLPFLASSTGTFSLYLVPGFGLPSEAFYLSLFFAFATLFPNHEFALMLVLPVKVWILAIISALGLIFQAIDISSSIGSALSTITDEGYAGISSGAFIFGLIMLNYAISFFPYLFWAVPRLWHWQKFRGEVSKRRVKFQAQVQGTKIVTLHSCQVCQRTEISNPELDFRVAENGDEYCLDHLDDEGKPTAHE